MTDQAVVENANDQSQGAIEPKKSEGKTEAPAKTESDASNAQGEPSLEDLLKEYETKAGNSGGQSDTSSKDEEEDDEIDEKELKRKIKNLDQLEKARQKEILDSDVKKAISSVKGDSNIPDELVRGFLYTLGDDERFKVAFMQRRSNPDGWNKVLAGAKTKLDGYIGSIREEIKKQLSSESTDAVVSAVRSSSTKTSNGKEVDYSAMTNAEFEQFKSKLG